jgi:hypothetical protein
MDSVVTLVGPGGPVGMQRGVFTPSSLLGRFEVCGGGQSTAGVAIEGSSFVLASLG